MFIVVCALIDKGKLSIFKKSLALAGNSHHGDILVTGVSVEKYFSLQPFREDS